MLSTTTILDTDKEIGEGFRPTAEELATHYLKRMLQGHYCHVSKIPEVDIYKYEPWDLPHLSGLSLSRSEWYFFCPRHDEKGSRRSRLTKEGFWKSTGKDREIKHGANREMLFKKKSLVYHRGRSGNRQGNRTNWVMHEIRATLVDGTTQGAYVICKIIKKPDTNVKVSTYSKSEPSSGNFEFSASTSCNRNSDDPTSTFAEETSRCSSYRQADNVEDEANLAADFEALSLNSRGENRESHTTIPEEVMVEQRTAASFIDYNKQPYVPDLIPESSVTPEIDQLPVFNDEFWSQLLSG